MSTTSLPPAWCNRIKLIWTKKSGIECWVGIVLLTLSRVSVTELIHYFAPKMGKQAAPFIDLYVVLVTVFSGAVYFFWPTETGAWLSTYFSAMTLIILLNTVLMTNVFGENESPERSLLLFIFNVAQIVFTFGIWYHLAGDDQPLLKSLLAFATIGWAEKAPTIVMVQIATDFILLAVFLSHLVGQVGGNRKVVAAQ